jgi:hypothetical protein
MAAKLAKCVVECINYIHVVNCRIASYEFVPQLLGLFFA